MRRLPTFILGVLAGVALLWTAMNYHLVRSQQGFHLVAKTSAGLSDSYVDARSFGPADWWQHAAAAEAVLRSKNKALIDEVMGGAVENGLNKILPPSRETMNR